MIWYGVWSKSDDIWISVFWLAFLGVNGKTGEEAEIGYIWRRGGGRRNIRRLKVVGGEQWLPVIGVGKESYHEPT